MDNRTEDKVQHAKDKVGQAAHDLKETSQHAAGEAKDRVGRVAQDLKEGSKNVVDETKDVAKAVVGDVKNVAKETTSYITSQLKDVREDLSAKAQGTVDQGRSQVAAQVGGLASAFQRAGEQLREGDQPQLAQYSQDLGQRVQDMASYLEDRDLKSVLADVETFARRQPLLFVGGAVALGLVAARMLKSSRPNEAN